MYTEEHREECTIVMSKFRENIRQAVDSMRMIPSQSRGLWEVAKVGPSDPLFVLYSIDISTYPVGLSSRRQRKKRKKKKEKADNYVVYEGLCQAFVGALRD